MATTNRTYISQFFNRANGATFYEYVNRMRIEHASRLLVESSDRLEIIAENSGFNSISTFYRAFAKHFGCSPTAYRERARSTMPHHEP